MRILVPALLCISACATTAGGVRKPSDLPDDAKLRSKLTGDWHGYWTGAASGTVLKARDGGLLEIPIVLEADLDADLHWNMDATDLGELMLEKSGHYNSSVWFVATDIEVVGHRIFITKDEESYEDTLCLELVGTPANGELRFQAHSFLADPGEGERDRCLEGVVEFDATLLLKPGPGNTPEFIESSGLDRFSADPGEDGEPGGQPGVIDGCPPEGCDEL